MNKLLEKTITAREFPEINTLTDNVRALVENGDFDRAYQTASKDIIDNRSLYGIFLDTDDDSGYLQTDDDVRTTKSLFRRNTDFNFNVVQDKKNATLYSFDDAEEIRNLLIKNKSVKSSNVVEMTADESTANTSEADLVISIFIKQLTPISLRNSVQNNFRKEFVTTLKTLGFSDLKNEYVAYLNILFDVNKYDVFELSKTGFDTVQKLYNDRIIDESILRGKAKGIGRQHIIFNKSLYANRNSADIQFIVQTFEWFGVSWQVLSYINQGSVKTNEQREIFSDIKLSIAENPIDSPCFEDVTILRDHIIFIASEIDEKVETNIAVIRSADDIERFVTVLESDENYADKAVVDNRKQSANSKQFDYVATKDTDVWSKALNSIKNDIDITNISDSQIRDLVNYIKSLGNE